MLRKTILALAATAALGVAALAPTAASAFPLFHHHHHGHFGHFGIGFYGLGDDDDGDCYMVKQRYHGYYRWVRVCD
jgi:hypothetical protein